MQINQINNINKQCSYVNKTVSNAIHSVRTSKVPDFGKAVAAVSGAYVVAKAINKNNDERFEILRSLNVSDENIEKILSVKNSQKQDVFSLECIKILSELANINGAGIFDSVMKNYQNVDNISKKESSFCTTYEISMDKGNKTISLNKMDNDYSLIVTQKTNSGVETSNILKSSMVIVDDFSKTVDKRTVKKESLVIKPKENSFTRTYSQNGFSIKKRTNCSQNGVIESVTEEKKKNECGKIINKDYKTNSEITADTGSYIGSILSQKKSYINPATGKREIHELSSSDVPGVYNSVITDEDGNVRIESFGHKNQDGSLYAEKHFESLDGTKTDFIYKSVPDSYDHKILDKEGNVTSKTQKNPNKSSSKFIETHYKITDINGNILTKVDRVFKRLSPTKTYSSINGHEYFMQRNPDNTIDVYDCANEQKTRINLDELVKGSQDNLKLFDNISGDMLLHLYNSGYTYQYSPCQQIFGASALEKNLISAENIFTFSHELGHTVDLKTKDDPTYDKTQMYQSKLSKHPEFLKAYNEECFNFINNMSDVEKDYIDYFINKTSHKESENGRFIETFAEAAALLSTEAGAKEDNIWARGYYLQKHFPKTISVVAKLMNPNSNIAIK